MKATNNNIITVEDCPELKRYGIKELTGGLTLDILKEKYKWVLEAKTTDAVLWATPLQLWWCGGIWHWGEWEYGVFNGGIWKNGIWYDGYFDYGTWENGLWLKGSFRGGTWIKGYTPQNSTEMPIDFGKIKEDLKTNN